MKDTISQVKVLISLIIVDALSKVMAFLLLPSDQPALPGALLQFVLRVNPTGVGSAGQKVLTLPGGGNYVTSTVVFAFGLGILLLGIACRRKLSAGIITFCIGAMLLVASIGIRVLPGADIGTIGNPVIFLRASLCFLWVVVWILVSSPIWKLGVLLFAAAAIGNFLSFFYPPHGIVDFIWSAPISRIVGFGIFNLADVFWLTGFIVFALAVLKSIAPRFKA